MDLPRYKCHKEVQAVKIKRVESNGHGQFDIVPEEEGYGPIEVSEAWFVSHGPEPGGYYVVYKDGYTSYSPAQAFEEGHTAIGE